MKKNPKIICTCKGNRHTCGLLPIAASNDPLQHQGTVEDMSFDTNSNQSAASNAGNETIPVAPLMNEDSGIDSLLNTLNVPSVPSALSSGNTSPSDMDTLNVPSVTASLSNDTTPDTETSLSLDTSSGIASSTGSEQQPKTSDKVGDGSSRMSLTVPPSASTSTPNLASNTGTPTGGTDTASKDDSGTKTSPSRPCSFTSGLRRSYHEFSKGTDDAPTNEDEILKCTTYVSTDEMSFKKKKTDEDLKGKSTSSSGSRSRTSSTSKSLESRDTSTENLSGLSADAHDENDWYVRMRTRGPKISVTGNVRPDGTIDETEERRSTEGGSFLSVNPPPEGDVCQNIYFDRKSPSLDDPPKEEENPQQKKDEDDKEDA